MTPVADAIEVEGLTKSFGDAEALRGLDLRVRAGEVHGFLGPNGAGKSTTIRVLLGLIRPDRGRVRLLGGDPWRQAPQLHRRLAYVPGDVALWPNFSGGEVIDLLARLRGGLDEHRRSELLDRFQLDPRKRCRAYSKGDRQKVALIAALSADVELLLLDEPTSGLDPLMEATFREVIGEELGAGRTVLLSSHILTEVEALCERVTIIREGRTVDSGTLAEMRHLTRTTIDASFERSAPDLSDLPGIHNLRAGLRGIVVDVDAQALNAVLARFTEAGVRSLVSRAPTLEDLFLRHYQRAAPGAPGTASPP